MAESKDISFRLWQMVSNVRHLIYKARQKELNRYGISMPSSGILDAVLRLGKRATPTAISQQSFRERHSISEQLSRMEKEGLIKKVKDLERKNLIRVEVTEKGYELSQKAAERESIEHIMSALTREEQRELWSLLSKLREKTMKYLGLENIEPYPPSDPDELLPTDMTA